MEAFLRSYKLFGHCCFFGTEKLVLFHVGERPLPVEAIDFVHGSCKRELGYGFYTVLNLYAAARMWEHGNSRAGRPTDIVSCYTYLGELPIFGGAAFISEVGGQCLFREQDKDKLLYLGCFHRKSPSRLYVMKNIGLIPLAYYEPK